MRPAPVWEAPLMRVTASGTSECERLTGGACGGFVFGLEATQIGLYVVENTVLMGSFCYFYFHSRRRMSGPGFRAGWFIHPTASAIRISKTRSSGITPPMLGSGGLTPNTISQEFLGRIVHARVVAQALYDPSSFPPAFEPLKLLECSALLLDFPHQLVFRG
jgi:hypothetical protein